MAKPKVLVAVAIGLAVVVVACLWLWRVWQANRPLPEPQQVTVPDAIPVDEIDLASPDLDVLLVGMRGTPNPSYTDWSCLLECREREGCRADIQLSVEYRSEGEPQTLILAGRLDGELGEVMRVGRVQRPPVTVDSIDRVSMTVLEVFRPNAPRPTEIE